MAHALLSPSAAHRWLKCPASVYMESQYPDDSSDFADEGTAAHELAEWALTSALHTPDNFSAAGLQVGDANLFKNQAISVNGKTYTITREMADYVNQYVFAVLSMAQGNELLIEQKVDFSEYVGLPNSFGTSDAIIITPDEIQVHDLKYGRGVQVDAENNVQMMIYALGAYHLYSLTNEFKQVRMVIHQPRLHHISESVISVDDLLTFGQQLKPKAQKVIQILETGDTSAEDSFNPGEKQCRFCAHKANCEKLANFNLQQIADGFVDVSTVTSTHIEAAHERINHCDNAHLANLMNVLDLIEDWCKAVRGRVEEELLKGEIVPGYKLVEGRKGARSWVDASEVETLLKSMRLRTEVMYDLKLISPTTAEKLYKDGTLGPKQWVKVQSYITQKQGAPSVAPESDKRPAINVVTADDFDVVSS